MNTNNKLVYIVSLLFIFSCSPKTTEELLIGEWSMQKTFHSEKMVLYANGYGHYSSFLKHSSKWSKPKKLVWDKKINTGERNNIYGEKSNFDYITLVKDGTSYNYEISYTDNQDVGFYLEMLDNWNQQVNMWNYYKNRDINEIDDDEKLDYQKANVKSQDTESIRDDAEG